MDKLSETLVSHPSKQRPASSKDACLVLIYPTGPAMGLRFALADPNVIIGRSQTAKFISIMPPFLGSTLESIGMRRGYI